MATLANPTVVDLLSREADQSAAANPPSRVVITVILAVFTGLGWLLGRTWWLFNFCVLAFRYGYRQGMKVPVEPKPAPA